VSKNFDTNVLLVRGGGFAVGGPIKIKNCFQDIDSLKKTQDG